MGTPAEKLFYMVQVIATKKLGGLLETTLFAWLQDYRRTPIRREY